MKIPWKSRLLWYLAGVCYAIANWMEHELEPRVLSVAIRIDNWRRWLDARSRQ